MGLRLEWMPPQAPYMPIATVGMLAMLEQARWPALAHWRNESGHQRLLLETDASAEDLAALLVEEPWPDLDKVPWGGKLKQGLNPTIKDAPDKQLEFRRLAEGSPQLERELLLSICTDGVLDDNGAPGRSRLLRGVKADLSSVSARPKTNVENVVDELRAGPRFRSGNSGLGLGLVPEVQTFGSTTGPEASSVGSYSPLLYLLLWRGILSLKPFAVVRGSRRVVGSHLTTAPDVISWPTWSVPADLPALKSLLVHPEIHADPPDLSKVEARGITAVYRARAVPLSTMVAVYRWGDLIAQSSNQRPLR